MTARRLHSVQEIARMLDAQAESLAAEIFPAGVRHGDEWVVGDLEGNPGRSLAVHIGAGQKRGVWKDFSSADRGGDMLELITKAICGGNRVAAIKWAKAWLGIDGGDKAALGRTREAIQQRRKAPKQDPSAARKRERAYKIWQAAVKDVRGTPVDRYLRGRAIELDRLYHPVTRLNYVPALPHYIGKEQVGVWPAMVAPIFDLRGKFMALHRTWLQEHADGRVTKAPIEEPKKTLGLYKGGIIPLWRGLRTDPDTGEIKYGLPLSQARDAEIDITEGIEDGLSVAISIPETRVWVGIAVNSMANIMLPDNVVAVTLWQQNDAPGSTAAAAFDVVVQNFQKQGKRVRMARAPAGFKDVNDWLQSKMARKEA